MSAPQRPRDQTPTGSPIGGEGSFALHEELDVVLRIVRDFVVASLHNRKIATDADALIAACIADAASQFHAALARGDSLDQARRALEIRDTIGEALSATQTASGRERLQVWLQSLPYPHFESDPTDPSLLIRIDADGTRTVGRFVNREFVVHE